MFKWGLKVTTIDDSSYCDGVLEAEIKSRNGRNSCGQCICIGVCARIGHYSLLQSANDVVHLLHLVTDSLLIFFILKLVSAMLPFIFFNVYLHNRNKKLKKRSQY